MIGVVCFYDVLEMIQIYEHKVFWLQVSMYGLTEAEMFVLVDDELLYSSRYNSSSLHLHIYGIFSRMFSSNLITSVTRLAGLVQRSHCRVIT